jgi:SAM-dependent methyltransferase
MTSALNRIATSEKTEDILSQGRNADGQASRANSKPWFRRILKRVNYLRCKAWDLSHNVDTCGEIPLSSLAFQSPNKRPGLEYQSHHPRIIRDAFTMLHIPYEQYTFVDFGCGKGRALLIASEFPFRRIVGLEFAPPLAQIAKNNLKSYRSHNRKCPSLEVLALDATSYDLPPEPEVLYFYSPFTGSVMEQAILNIEQSLRYFPRELLVLFSGIFVMRDRAFGSRPQYQRLWRERHFDLYRYCGHGIAATEFPRSPA